MSYYRFPGLLFNKIVSGGIPVGLFEGFESFSGGVPNTKSWNKVGGLTTVNQSTSNVTQGVFSGEFIFPSGASNSRGIVSAINYDFSGITNILLDVKPSGVANTSVVFFIFDGTNQTIAQTTLGSGTATTLTLTPTLPVNKASAKLYILSDDAVANAGQTFYCDNLRCT